MFTHKKLFFVINFVSTEMNANNADDDVKNVPPTYETISQNFQFLPIIINSLNMVSNNTDLHKLNVQVARLNEAMRNSLLYLDTLEGVDLTTKQQEELLEKYKKSLAEKMFVDANIFINTLLEN